MKYFKPEDFAYDYTDEEKADTANAKLQKLIEASPVVYGIKSENQWIKTDVKQNAATHKARLMFIEPIVKECLQHEPEYPIILKAGSDGVSYEQVVQLLNGTKKCKHCGIELKAEWKEAK